MVDPSTWELEAWKAQVGLLDRFILILFGALFSRRCPEKKFIHRLFYMFSVSYLLVVCLSGLS
jgi:hypothetical protein